MVIYFFVYAFIGFLYTLVTLINNYFFSDEIANKSVWGFSLGLIFGALVWPVIAYYHVNSYINPPFIQEDFKVTKQDLIEEFSVAGIEKKEMVTDPLMAVPQIPFGHLNPLWQVFKKKHSPVTLWSFKSEYKQYSFILIKEGYAKLEGSGSVTGFFINQEYLKPDE